MSEANLNPTGVEADMYNLAMSDEAAPLLDAVKKFIAEEVAPISEEFYRLGEGRADRWSWAPGQLELLDGAKAKAKAQGLWNFFLPDADTGEGLLSNRSIRPRSRWLMPVAGSWPGWVGSIMSSTCVHRPSRSRRWPWWRAVRLSVSNSRLVNWP